MTHLVLHLILIDLFIFHKRWQLYCPSTLELNINDTRNKNLTWEISKHNWWYFVSPDIFWEGHICLNFRRYCQMRRYLPINKYIWGTIACLVSNSVLVSLLTKMPTRLSWHQWMRFKAEIARRLPSVSCRNESYDKYFIHKQ